MKSKNIELPKEFSMEYLIETITKESKIILHIKPFLSGKKLMEYIQYDKLNNTKTITENKKYCWIDSSNLKNKKEKLGIMETAHDILYIIKT